MSWSKNSLSRFVIGAIAGIVTGFVSAAMLKSAAPNEWFDLSKDLSGFSERELARILWATIATGMALVSWLFGGKDLGNRVHRVVQGALYGCITATLLTLVIA